VRAAPDDRPVVTGLSSAHQTPAEDATLVHFRCHSNVRNEFGLSSELG